MVRLVWWETEFMPALLRRWVIFVSWRAVFASVTKDLMESMLLVSQVRI